jgi:hypothetical protein
VKTPKDRAEERRQEKLTAIREQVESGELTIRKMTPKERAAHPPREGKRKR